MYDFIAILQSLNLFMHHIFMSDVYTCNINALESNIYIFFFILEVFQYFSDIMEKEPDVSASIAAIITLLKLLEHDKCK